MKTLLLILLILFILLLSACAGKKVKTEDLNSWHGQTVATLESHPFYASLIKEVHSSENTNEQIIIFIQKRLIEVDNNKGCFGAGVGIDNFGLGTLLCSPSEKEERNCVHQFTVNQEIIKQYVILGEGCYTECKMRPSQKCEKD